MIYKLRFNGEVLDKSYNLSKLKNKAKRYLKLEIIKYWMHYELTITRKKKVIKQWGCRCHKQKS